MMFNRVRVIFNARPNAENIDSVIGFSDGEANAYSDLGIIVRFSPTGKIDARNGSGYEASTNYVYEANTNYTFRLVIDFNTKKYSIYVTAEGENEVLIGENYDFRSEQSDLNSINNMAYFSRIKDVVFVTNPSFVEEN